MCCIFHLSEEPSGCTGGDRYAAGHPVYSAPARRCCSQEGIKWEGGVQSGFKSGALLSSSTPVDRGNRYGGRRAYLKS